MWQWMAENMRPSRGAYEKQKPGGLRPEYAWFMKVDIDTYVNSRSLRHFLSHLAPHKPLYLGQQGKIHAFCIKISFRQLDLC